MIQHTTLGAGPIAPPRPRYAPPRVSRVDFLGLMHRDEVEAATWAAEFADPKSLCWLPENHPVREVRS